jgi:hypothetical protein
MKLASLALIPLFALPLFTMSNADEDRAAVERAVKDYVEGIYQVKPELVERGVHADLAKLGFWRADETTEYRGPMSMTKQQLVELSKEWNAEGRELTYEVELLDVLDKTAAAKLTAHWGIDYMHLMKTDGKWQIIHVLWQSPPPKE